MLVVYRFLLSGRWLGLLALALVVAVACVLLGSWQWHRREARLERNAQVVENYDRDPVPLGTALPDPSQFPDGATWTPVQVDGEYVSDATTLVRNRNRDGRPGYQVLVPLLADDGRVLVVDRGFVPIGETGERPDAVPAPPTGEVAVVSRLRVPEPTDDREAPPGQTLRINPEALADQLAAASGARFTAADVVTGAYGDLAAEEPAPATRPQPEPRPALDEGSHLSYAMQWVVFAIGALVGFVVLARRAAQDDADDRAEQAARLDGEGAAGVPPRPVRPAARRPRQPSRTRRPSAEDEEDALLDAAEERAGKGTAGGPAGPRPADRV